MTLINSFHNRDTAISDTFGSSYEVVEAVYNSLDQLNQYLNSDKHIVIGSIDYSLASSQALMLEGVGYLNFVDSDGNYLEDMSKTTDFKIYLREGTNVKVFSTIDTITAASGVNTYVKKVADSSVSINEDTGVAEGYTIYNDGEVHNYGFIKGTGTFETQAITLYKGYSDKNYVVHLTPLTADIAENQVLSSQALLAYSGIGIPQNGTSFITVPYYDMYYHTVGFNK